MSRSTSRSAARFDRRTLAGLGAGLVGAAAGACGFGQLGSGGAPTASSAGPKAVPLGAPPPIPGRLLYSTGNALLSRSIAGGDTREVVRFPSTVVVAVPAITPDGTLVAFTRYDVPAQRTDAGGADLYLVDTGGATGGTPRLLLAHDEPGVSFDEPAWSAGGQAVYFTRRASRYDGTRLVGEDIRIERVGLDGSGRQVVVEDASAPALSGDGRLLAYLSPATGRRPSGLWLAAPDGSAARQQISPVFQQILAPRFSPTSARLVFGAVGPPPDLVAPARAENPRPGVAYAHGMPADLWLIGVEDGGGRPVRLTDVGEDAPSPAWSPDGAWIAFSGERGLYLVSVGARTLVRFAEVFAASIAWQPA